jgi:hypothetical protein
MPSGQQTAIDLKVTPWNPGGLNEFSPITFIQNEGDKLALMTPSYFGAIKFADRSRFAEVADLSNRRCC